MDARASAGGISIGDGQSSTNIPGLKYDFARCCNPIPGDEVIGYITKTEGIKIHRRNCNNIVNLYLMDCSRIVDINWGESALTEFSAGIRIIGEDRPGILNDITEMISKTYKINIISANIFTKGSTFEGTIIMNVEDLKQLNSVIEKISQHKGVINAMRFNG
jgi:(p)ppGpp synthase/HD superfamily hydrolase